MITKKPDMVDLLSDDEATPEEVMMPPPALPAAKPARTRATKTKQSTTPAESGSVKIKQEPVDPPKRTTRSKKPSAKATAAAAAAAKKALEEEEGEEDTFENIVPKVRNSSLANASTVSTETSVTTAQQQQKEVSQPITEPEKEKTRSKARTKSKKPVIDKVTKLVIPEPEEVVLPTPVVEAEVIVSPEAVEEESRRSTRKSSPVAGKTAEKEVVTKKATKKSSSKKVSTESVYEDAKGDSKLFNSQVSLENIQKVKVEFQRHLVGTEGTICLISK